MNSLTTQDLGAPGCEISANAIGCALRTSTGGPAHIRARQKDAGRAKARSDELADLRDSARTLRNKTGSLGIFIGTFSERSHTLDRSIVSPSAYERWPSQRLGLVLRATRLRHSGSHANGQSGRGDENHGTQDLKSAMHYHHLELETVRAALDYNAGAEFCRNEGVAE